MNESLTGWQNEPFEIKEFCFLPRRLSNGKLVWFKSVTVVMDTWIMIVPPILGGPYVIHKPTVIETKLFT